jgi:ABC-type bacteriocin/lantibiotic exporter with double-glycine peptidase domain
MDYIDLAAVLPKETARFAYVAEQGADASCAFAALSSWLSLYWDSPASEAQLILEAAALQEKAAANGDGSAKGDGFGADLSVVSALLDARGFASRAYRLDWTGLAAAAGRYAPLLVHYDRPDGHFALLLGFRGEAAVVADPARGLETVERAEFERRWSGVALAALPAPAAARATETGAPPRRDEDRLAAALARADRTRNAVEAEAGRLAAGDRP